MNYLEKRHFRGSSVFSLEPNSIGTKIGPQSQLKKQAFLQFHVFYSNEKKIDLYLTPFPFVERHKKRLAKYLA